MANLSRKIESLRAIEQAIIHSEIMNMRLKKLIKFDRITLVKPNRYILIAALGLLFLFSAALEGYAQRTVAFPHDETIILDPGHGGHDTGVQGPKGLLEKRVVLTLARRIQSVVGHHQIILTRTDDYKMTLDERASIANNADADLFISLHTAGSPRHETSGMTIYYYEKADGHLKADRPDDAEKSKQENHPVLWDNIQLKHVSESRRFAQILQKKLSNDDKTASCELRGAPIMVLKGVDIPAVLLEIGYLTHPIEEKRLNNPEAIHKIAESISLAIDEFLVRTP